MTFKSIDDVKKYIEKQCKKYRKRFVTPYYTIEYSNRQKRALASCAVHCMLSKPYKIVFKFNNKYLASYKINEQNIKDTVLHEIAHAIVDSKHHHDSVWKACCYEIGCQPNRQKKINH